MRHLKEPLPFSGSLFGIYLILVLLPLTLRLKHSPYRQLFFLPILGLTYYVILHTTTGAFNGDYPIGIIWLTELFTVSDYILLTDVQRELHRSEQPRRPKSSTIEHASFWQRFKWAVDLLHSPRGIGWAHEPVSALPPHPPINTPRASFVLNRLATTLYYFLMHDLANLHMRWNSMYRAGGAGLTAFGWPWRAVGVVGWGVAAYSALAMQGALLSAISVALGLSSPESWPALFGGLREAWSIRNFWARGWHQLMRRFLSVHGKYIAHNILRLAPGSNLSGYVQLYASFLISGTIHYLAETMALRHWGGRAMHFFISQAVAITIEGLIISLGKRGGIQAGRGVRLVGYAWTLWWFSLCMPMWQDPLIYAGATDDGLPVSLVMGLFRGQWLLPPLKKM